MKTVFALALALTALSTNVQAAIPYTILEATRSPGLEPFPQTKHFYVQDDGKMTLEVTTYREGNKKEVIDLGTLSEVAVRGLLEQVNDISADYKLVDPEEGQPMCTDTPSYDVAVFIKGERKVISRASGCHQWMLEGSQGLQLVGFASTFIRM